MRFIVLNMSCYVTQRLTHMRNRCVTLERAFWVVCAEHYQNDRLSPDTKKHHALSLGST